MRIYLTYTTWKLVDQRVILGVVDTEVLDREVLDTEVVYLGVVYLEEIRLPILYYHIIGLSPSFDVCMMAHHHEI